MSRIPDEIVVPDDGEGKRVDHFLRDHLTDVSRAYIRRQIEKGRVARNGRAARKGATLNAGDRLDISRFVDPAERTIAAADGDKLVVLHEDRDVIVVEKEAGLPTLPVDEEDRLALACRLADRYGELARVGKPLEAGLLHRLDTGTSGLLVAARTEEAWRYLRDQWRWRRVEKRYIALVRGGVRRSFTCILPISHHPSSGRRMVAGRGGRSAETRFRSLVHSEDASLLMAELREGRRHQIRVHLAEAGHPVVGDELYGGDREDPADRLMLHAGLLRFRPNEGREELVVASQPPADFLEHVVRALGGEAPEAIRNVLRSGPRGR